MSYNEKEKETPSPEHAKKDKETDELVERMSKLLARRLLEVYGSVDNSESTSNAGETVDESSELNKKRKEKPEKSKA